MSDIEKERLSNLINDLNEEEALYIMSIIPSDLLLDELSRRDHLKSKQLKAIDIILNGA